MRRIMILRLIAGAKSEDLQDILQGLLRRYREVHPEWEISTVSIEKGKDRNQQLDAMIAVLERMKERPSC